MSINEKALEMAFQASWTGNIHDVRRTIEAYEAAKEQPVQYLCNRSACRAEGATYWNTSTRAYYCKKCADAINEGAGTKITGVPLCIPLSSMPLPVAQAAPYHKEFPKRESAQPVQESGDDLPPGMVKIKEMIADLQSIMDRFGNTCVYIKPGVSWGATALWRRDDAVQAIEETAISFAGKFKPEYKELAQQIMEHAISEGWTHQFASPEREICLEPDYHAAAMTYAKLGFDKDGKIIEWNIYELIKRVVDSALTTNLDIEGDKS